LPGWVDLHCHWLPEVDDGARSLEEGRELLERLGRAGFAHVVATPHLRPGLFEGTPASLLAAFHKTQRALEGAGLPEVSLGSEHFFDPAVIDWILKGEGLPYGSQLSTSEHAANSEGASSSENPGLPRQGGAILIEFRDLAPAPVIDELLLRLQRARFLPVIAHPERYPSVWTQPELAERVVERGAVLLLDVASLVGKYGRASQKAAFELLEREAYGAACTDSHRPADADLARAGMERLEHRYGRDEVEFLFGEGPRKILRGQAPV
jgi:protein-tyrosine phosphatase